MIIHFRQRRLFLSLREVYRHSVSVIEPWQNVGISLAGEEARASKNTAYIFQQAADADAILYPPWQSGISNPKRLSNIDCAE
ncbi:MAG: hypothetical protein AAGF57_15435 [Pseudomonadota bacterium]